MSAIGRQKRLNRCSGVWCAVIRISSCQKAELKTQNCAVSDTHAPFERPAAPMRGNLIAGIGGRYDGAESLLRCVVVVFFFLVRKPKSKYKMFSDTQATFKRPAADPIETS